MGKYINIGMQLMGALSIVALFWQNWVIALAVCGLIWSTDYQHLIKKH